jgi:hypothetical protein
MAETTFGCGDFLPGRGPFNFPDFIEGGTVNGPDPPEPDPPGTRTEADPFGPPIIVDGGGGSNNPFVAPGGASGTPPGGGGGGGGGGPFTPIGGQPPAPGPSVPSTPGPQVPGAPTAPPNPKVCRCVITTEGANFLPISTNAAGQVTYSIIFQQKCERIDLGTPDPTVATVTNYINNLGLPSGGTISIEGAVGFGDCNTGPQIAPRCNGSCPSIQAFYIIPPPVPPPDAGPPAINPGDGPPRPGPISPRPKPTGGSGPFTPIGELPSSPAPSVPGGGGGGGGSGPISLGPQGPAPPQVPYDPGNNSGGGGDPIGTLPEADPTGGFNFVGGGVIGRSSGNTIKNITNALETTSSIDLGDPEISREILAQRPSGFEEEEIFFDDTPEKSVFVENTSNITDIFARVIDNNILYLLQNQSTVGDWDSKRAGGVTPTTVYNSLNEETREILSRILNYDRTPINRSQIYHMIGSRILDGTIAKVTKGSLKALADGSKNETPLVVTRSRSDIVNETVALALVEKNYYPLDPNASTGLAGETLKNQKTLASDLDRFISIIIGGQTRRYYVNDDDTFIGRSTLALSDGEYFDITLGGKTSRLFAESEKSHAFFVPEKTRQIAINILGGNASRTLSVSGDPNGIELDYSLTAPRENLYFLSCVLDSIVTTPDAANTRHIKTTTARYEYVSLRAIDDINEFIKYKNNHQTFILDDDDRLLDYVERDGNLYLTQNDIIVDSPKENQTMPLLTRQIPWYILLYPSNKSENNPFNGKSQIVDITPSSSTNPGSITRQLKTRTSINPKFRNAFNQFVSVELVGRGGVDLLGEPTNQARINKINLNNKLLSSGYINREGEVTSAATYNPNRSKTGYRLITEIIKDLDNNYLLGLNGIGKSLTEFDVLSRLNFKQFNLLSRTENYNVLKQSLFNGMVNNVKVTPGTKNSDSKIAIRKTQLVRRRSTAEDQDQYPEIKSTNFNRAIAPPTTAGPSEFIPYKPPSPPTAL